MEGENTDFFEFTDTVVLRTIIFPDRTFAYYFGTDL